MTTPPVPTPPLPQAPSGTAPPPGRRRPRRLLLVATAAVAVVVGGTVAAVALTAGNGPAPSRPTFLGPFPSPPVWPAPGTASPQAAVSGLFDAVFERGRLADALPYVAPPEVRARLGALVGRVAVVAHASGLHDGIVTRHGAAATVGVVGRVCGGFVELVLGTRLTCAANARENPTGNWRIPCVELGGAWFVDLLRYPPLAPLVRSLLGPTP